MNDSFFSRQLTPFREWPDGKKGILFYVKDPSLRYRLDDAIVLIDSPIRANDELGAYDTLHKKEVSMISADTIVISGYAAFIIYRFLDKKEKSHMDALNFFADLNEWYSYYENRIYCFSSDYSFFMSELQAIIDCKQQIVNELMKPFFSVLERDINPFLYVAYEIPLKKWIEKDHALIFNQNMKIIFSDHDNANATLRADYKNEQKKWIVSGDYCFCYIKGIQAFFLNHSVAYSVCNEFVQFASMGDFIADVDKLMKYLWTEPVNYDELFCLPQEFDFKSIYDTYVESVLKPIYERLSLQSIQFNFMDENKKKAIALKELFLQEWEDAKNNEDAISHISDRNRELLNFSLQYFFDYIRQLIKDFPDEYNECTALMNPTQEPDEPAVTPADTPDTMPLNVPLLRNSFIKNLRQVYDILVLENFVLPDCYELFENAMTFRLEPDQHIVWKGKKYELASFIDYAFEGTGEDKWLAATLWSCKGEIQTPAKLKGNLNRIPTDNSVKQWRERFKNLP